MLYTAIDIHKHAFQAAVLDAESGQVVEERFTADRESLARWAEPWRGRVGVVAIEATTGWRWVWRELVARGFEVRLAEPLQARALLGRRRSAKSYGQTDRLSVSATEQPSSKATSGIDNRAPNRAATERRTEHGAAASRRSSPSRRSPACPNGAAFAAPSF